MTLGRPKGQNGAAGAASLAQLWRDWMIGEALPLWSRQGFDATRGLFEEQLDFTGAPIRSVPKRLMVQARQISVFCLTASRGWFPAGRALAAEAAETMIGRFFEADGRPGWVFSVDLEGRPVRLDRDLYAHAFVLFALSWLVKDSCSARVKAALESTLSFLERDMAFADGSGFADALPAADPLRRQNPHMHLFEASLELLDTGRVPPVCLQADRLRDTAVSRFYDPGSGCVRELFDETWRVHPGAGLGCVEPGHQFEWAWLLRRYEGRTGRPQDAVVERLLAHALRHGFDVARGRVIDEVGEDGQARRTTSRSWPHLEALKALCAETRRGADFQPEIAALLHRVLKIYCPADLNGGWIDHVDEDDLPLSKVMPASTFYHLAFALAEVEESLRPTQSDVRRDAISRARCYGFPGGDS